VGDDEGWDIFTVCFRNFVIFVVCIFIAVVVISYVCK
jgi:hypothetical protein